MQPGQVENESASGPSGVPVRVGDLGGRSGRRGRVRRPGGPPGSTGGFYGALAALGFFLAAAFAGYWTILNNTFVADDFWNTEESGRVPLSHIWQLIYVQSPTFLRPLPYLTWWLHYNLLGFDAWPGHVFNVALHGGSAFIFYLLLKRLGAARITAFLAALLFAVTPIGPEAVTYIGGRPDVMALFFVLLSLLLYVAAVEKNSRGVLAGSMVAAAAALLSKENAAVLVVLIPLLELLLYRRGTHRQAGSRLLMFASVFVFYALLRYIALGGVGGYSGSPLLGVATWESVKVTAGTMLAPLNSFFFPASTIHAVLLYTGALLLLSIIFVIFRWRRVSGQARRLWIFVVSFFLVSVVSAYPYTFLVKGGVRRDMDASRYLYFAAMGLIAIIVVGLLEFGLKKRGARMALVAMLAVLAPAYLWGLQHNDRPWEQAAAITYSVPRQVQALLPDPPAHADLYFLQNLPYWANGAYIFIDGLPQALRYQYGRNDLTVRSVAAAADPRMADGEYVSFIHGDPVDGQQVGLAIPPDDTSALAQGYLFSYDRSTGILSLVHGPTVCSLTENPRKPGTP